MKPIDVYNYGFGVEWQDVLVTRRDGYYTSVTDYHEHEFYEINLILSGNVKILLKDSFEEGSGNKIVVTAPKTPHYISCKADAMYSRLYLVFTPSFISGYFPEYESLLAVFGDYGRVIQLSEADTEYLKGLFEQIKQEPYLLGKRLLVYHLLLRVSKLCEPKTFEKNSAPRYIIESISYIEANYQEKITAEGMAKRCFVGRTTYLTEFKKHLGITFGEYLTACRLKKAIVFFSENLSIEATAEKCGFADSSGLIRAFKKHFHATPYQYMKNKKQT